MKIKALTGFILAGFAISIPACSGGEDSLSSEPKDIFLAAYYPFNGNADDESGRESHGVVNGIDPALGSDSVAGHAYYFNGNNSYVSVDDTSNFQSVDALTVAAWVRTDSMKSQIILRKGGGLVIPKYELYLAGNGDFGFKVGANTIFKSGGYSLSTWTHVAGTYNGANMILYINGVSVDTLSVINALVADKNLLLIGTRTASNADTFAGRIDEVRIYNKALNPAEIGVLSTR